LRNPESFDPLKIGRFTVIRVHYEYPNEFPEEKLFIVLRHAVEKGDPVCHCIKPTSRTDRFEVDPRLLRGVILYPANQLPFFYRRTIVDPNNPLKISHSLLEREAGLGRFKIEGVMPEDFRTKLVEAIKQSFVLEPKNKKYLMECSANVGRRAIH